MHRLSNPWIVERPIRFAWLASVAMGIIFSIGAGQRALVAAEPPAWLAEVRSAIAMIDNRGFGGGSGTLVASDLILTCDHLFRDDRSRQSQIGRVSVTFANGEGSEGEVIAQDPIWDLALLRLRHPPRSAHPVSISQTLPRPGDAIVSCGFGGRGAVWENFGQVKGYGQDKHRSTSSTDTLIVSGTARSGDSGGPMFNAEGELCGVLWGASPHEVVGTQCGRCQQFGGSYLCPPENGVANGPSANLPQSGRQTAAPLPSAKELESVKAEIAALRRQLTELARVPGPPGPAGVAGPPGPRGPEGQPGPTGNAIAGADLERLANQVKQKLAGSLRIRVEPLPNRGM